MARGCETRLSQHKDWRSQHHGERKREISKTAALAGNKFKAKYGWMILRTAEDGVIC
jgi:hypothetical protein